MQMVAIAYIDLYSPKDTTWFTTYNWEILISSIINEYMVYYGSSMHIQYLTLVLLNCFNCIFRHLKLELLTQFPASNDEKYYYFWKIDMSKIKLLDQLSIYKNLFYQN